MSDSFGSIMRQARGLYESGLAKREVVRRCFGAVFPDEFFAVASEVVFFEFEEIDDVSWAPPFSFANLAWEVALPPGERDWPEPEDHTRFERQMLERDPRLVPLLRFSNRYAVHGGYVVCYRLDELQAGRSTVFRFRPDHTHEADPARAGDTLLAVMHEHLADAVRRANEEISHPNNIGAGSIGWDEVEWKERWLSRIEELQRR